MMTIVMMTNNEGDDDDDTRFVRISMYLDPPNVLVDSISTPSPFPQNAASCEPISADPPPPPPC